MNDFGQEASSLAIGSTVLINENSIYMLDNGRINIAGLNDSNVTYVADSINSVL